MALACSFFSPSVWVLLIIITLNIWTSSHPPEILWRRRQRGDFPTVVLWHVYALYLLVPSIQYVSGNQMGPFYNCHPLASKWRLLLFKSYHSIPPALIPLAHAIFYYNGIIASFKKMFAHQRQVHWNIFHDLNASLPLSETVQHPNEWSFLELAHSMRNACSQAPVCNLGSNQAPAIAGKRKCRADCLEMSQCHTESGEQLLPRLTTQGRGACILLEPRPGGRVESRGPLPIPRGNGEDTAV